MGIVSHLTWEFIKHNPYSSSALLACTLLIPIVEVLVPFSFGRLIMAVTKRGKGFETELLFFVGSIVMLQVAYALHDLAEVWVQPAFADFVRTHAVSTVMDIMKPKYDVVDIGDVVNRATKLPWSVNTIVRVWMVSFLPIVVTSIIISIYVSKYDPLLAASVLVLAGLYVYSGSSLLPNKCRAVSVNRDLAINTYVSKVDDLMRNLCSIYVEGTKQVELERVSEYSNRYMDLYRKTIKCFLPSHIYAFVGIIIIITVFFAHTKEVLKNGTMTLGVFTTTSLLISSLVNMIMVSTDQVKELTVHYGILDQCLDLLQPVPLDSLNSLDGASKDTSFKIKACDVDNEDVVRSEKVDVNQGVHVNRVTFRTLHEYSRYFPPGQLSVVRGQNGCGKTTLFKIILNHVAPTTGTVTVWGQPNDRQLWRIGYVPQSPALFDRSVYTNIIYGNPSPPSQQEVRALIDDLDLAQHIPPLDTRVGKAGGLLSGGQRQLVCILRLFCNDIKDVWLLDEPTSALDAHAKTVVVNMLHRVAESKNKTVIAIMH